VTQNRDPESDASIRWNGSGPLRYIRVDAEVRLRDQV
jgi:hypothetical protein